MSFRFVRRFVGVAAALCLAGTAVAVGSITTPGQILALPGASESTVVMVEPTRVLDTRYNIGLTGQVVASTSRKLVVTGVIDTYIEATATFITKQVVPAGATGVLLNVTAVSPTAAGFLSIRPGTATGVPATAGLNFKPGDVIPNAVTVALPIVGDYAGRIDIYYGAQTVGATLHVVADVVGYTTNTGLVDLTNRLVALETAGVEGPAGPQGATGDPGAAGAAGATGDPGAAGATGPTNRISDEKIAQLQWYEDPGAAATYTTGSGPRGVAFDGTNIWITNYLSNTVSKMNPADGTKVDYPTGTLPWGVAFDGTNIWITNYVSGTVSKMNPANGTKVDYTTGSNPRGVAFDGTNIWIANSGSNTVSKMNPGWGV